MLEYKQLDQGVWHVTKFFDDDTWKTLQQQILDLSDNDFPDHVPYRLRVSLLDSPLSDISNTLVNYSSTLKPLLTELTGHTEFNKWACPTIWRDTEKFHSWWHADDYTRKPTIQIYVNGPEEYGTSFKINNETVTLPFIPNSGYLMDNQYQPVHGMIGTLGENLVRQSIYLIY